MVINMFLLKVQILGRVIEINCSYVTCVNLCHPVFSETCIELN